MNTISGLTIQWEPWTITAVLIHLWQSTIMGLVILLLMIMARRASARTRWILGWIGLIKFILPLVWFNPTISRLEPDVMTRWSHLPATLTSFESGAVSDKFPLEFSSVHAISTASAGKALLPWVCLSIWVSVAISLIGRWCWRGYRFRRWLLAASDPISVNLARRVKRASERVGLTRPPRCVSIGARSGPGIVGIFAPIVVMPQSLELTLSGAEIDAILTHELTHLRRCDALLAGLQAIVVRLFWFDPVAWLLNRSLRIEMEKSCDEAVLDITADAKVYAGGILKIVRQSLGPREPNFTGVTGVPIVSRIRNILARSASPHRRRPMMAAIGAAFALVAFSGFSGAIRTATAASVPVRKVLVVLNDTSWRRIPDFEAQLGDLGYSSSTIESAQMATTDLSQFKLIVIPGTQHQSGFDADYAKARERFDRFVQSGGTLLLEVNGTEGEGILRQRYHAIPNQSESSSESVPQ